MQKIHINDQGELILRIEGQPDVKFRDQEAVRELVKIENGKYNSELIGQSFDLPNSYTAQVVDTPCCKLNPLGCDDCTNYQKYAKLCIRN